MARPKLTGLGFETAERGTKYIGAITSTVEAAGYVVNADGTVIDSAKEDDETSSDAAGTYNKGMIITTAKTRFTEVVVSSGSLIAIKH